MSQSHGDRAGPAGAAAAVQVARLGLSVALIDKALIDKARFPRDKLCVGLYSGRAMTYHREIFQDEIDEAIHSGTDAVAFWHRKTSIGRLDGVARLYLTMRQDLDIHLMRRAGATDLTGQRIAALDLDGQSVTLAGGERVGWRCLIRADGVNSQMGKAFIVKKLSWHLKFKQKMSIVLPKPRSGSTLSLSKGAMGGFFLKRQQRRSESGAVASRPGSEIGDGRLS